MRICGQWQNFALAVHGGFPGIPRVGLEIFGKYGVTRWKTWKKAIETKASSAVVVSCDINFSEVCVCLKL